jgi:hypothetical protein
MKEQWDKPGMSVTCPQRCERVLVQPSVGTENLAPCDKHTCTRNLAKMPNTAVSHLKLLTVSQEK